jgi:hypothetical protein
MRALALYLLICHMCAHARRSRIRLFCDIPAPSISVAATLKVVDIIPLRSTNSSVAATPQVPGCSCVTGERSVAARACSETLEELWMGQAGRHQPDHWQHAPGSIVRGCSQCHNRKACG